MAAAQIDENVYREIINHRSLRHPNIIRFKEVRGDELLLPLWSFFVHVFHNKSLPSILIAGNYLEGPG
jgi:hypothetical protein